MRKKEWINGNKMKIETGHKTFDNQTNLITTGNVVANTLHGVCVRAYNNNHNGYEERPLGFLQNWDLTKNFNENIPGCIRDHVSIVDRENKHILYKVRHFNGGNEIIHGYILTKSRDDEYEHVKTFCSRPGYNISYEILFTVRDYLCKNQPYEQYN
jgi:hypothetical protein